jgi:hypothetical protein
VSATIIASTQGGSYEPYFGVCLPVGWTIPGDSIQCGGAYEEVIHYDALITSWQESASPAPAGYYWWAGKGIPEGTAVGNVFANLKIQTDSQLGEFSIDYMLGDGYNGVNYERSNNHLIEITTDPLILFGNPDEGYQNFTLNMSILGLNTHFSDGTGTDNVWLSKNSNEIYANSFIVNNNTSLDANFLIPLTADTGLWNVNVETDIDGMITKVDGFNILSSPPIVVVSPDSIVVGVFPGSTRTKTITIGNEGEGDLYFDIIGGLGSTNYALQFDGIDDEVVVGYSPVLDILGDITVCVWYKTVNPNWGALVCNYDPFNPDNGYELCSSSMYEEGGFIYFECAYDDSRDGFSTDSAFNDDVWHFVSAVYTPNGFSRGKVFVDGIEQTGYFLPGSVPLPAIGTTPDYPFKIGAANSAAFFEGLIDEVRIWDKALTQEEILLNMYYQLSGSEENLIGYWQFNKGDGDIAFDKTINENHGTLFGGVEWTDIAAPVLPGWFQMSTDSGFCSPHLSMDIELLFDATEVDTGNYYASITIKSNDPFTPSVRIPIHMIVSSSVGIEDGFGLPLAFNLYQNYPNPFNPNTTIKYSIPELCKVRLTLFNLLGEEVTTLVNEEMSAGNYSAEFNAANLPSGVYFYRIQAGSFVETKKMLLIK